MKVQFQIQLECSGRVFNNSNANKSMPGYQVASNLPPSIVLTTNNRIRAISFANFGNGLFSNIFSVYAHSCFPYKGNPNLNLETNYFYKF